MLDQVDTPRLEALNRAWGDCPPLCDMVASYFGIKPRKPPSRNYGELVAMFPGGRIR